MNFWRGKEGEVDPQAVKARSRAEIERLGGRTIDPLPIIDPTTARSGEALAARALVLNAIVGLAYDVPARLLREWIVADGLTQSLSAEEAKLLEGEPIEEQAKINLSWSLEAIYALLWAGGFTPSLPLDAGSEQEAFNALPRVLEDETGREFTRRVRLRPYAELYAMRDLYYRAHWFTRDGRLNGYDTAPFDGDVIMERRKALEWLLDETVDWDDVEMNT